MRTRHTLARAVSCVNEADLFEQSDQIPPDCSRSDSSSCLISGRFRKSTRALDHGGGESNSKEHKYARRCWLSIGHEVAKWEGVSSSSAHKRQQASSWQSASGPRNLYFITTLWRLRKVCPERNRTVALTSLCRRFLMSFHMHGSG